MDQQTAIKALQELEGDRECTHSEAEDILIEFLHSNNLSPIADAYLATKKRIGFWYA